MKNNNHVKFSDLLLWTNRSILETALLCGKSEKTIQTYLKTNKPCLACRTLLIWLYFGIPQINGWKDWKFRNGELISPTGIVFNEKQLEMVPILHEWVRQEENKLTQSQNQNQKLLF